MPNLFVIRAAIALVWLYEGLWCKVLGRAPHQEGIVETVPGLTGGQAHVFLLSLGLVECGLGIWVLAGWQPVWAAAAQTALLVGMNTGGVLWARKVIQDPPGMVVKNFAFVMLMWVAAALAHA
jgi:hypothetical protein